MASKVVYKDNFDKNLDRMIKELPDILDDAYDYLKSITPYKTGNARRNTKQIGDDIHLDYDYATFSGPDEGLDEGRSSQAPLGMTDPTTDYINKRVKKWVKKHG